MTGDFNAFFVFNGSAALLFTADGGEISKVAVEGRKE